MNLLNAPFKSIEAEYVDNLIKKITEDSFDSDTLTAMGRASGKRKRER